MKFPYESETHGTLELERVLKESEKSQVYLVRGESRYVLRRVPGEREVYEKLMELRSPNLPRILEVRGETGELTVLEEYIPGDNLSFLLQGASMEVDQCREILLQICDALTLLHQNGIVHRDVKPENIMIDGKTAVLIDYDAARFHKVSQESDTRVLGTTGYAAPEQYGLSQTDSRADIYAMGVLLNIMINGQHPSTELAPNPAGKIVRKCTMVSPDLRFQSVEQLRKRLEHLTSRKKWRNRWIAAILCLVVIIGAAAGVVYKTQGDKIAQAQEMAAAREAGISSLGYYPSFPENSDDRIDNFQFVVTDTTRTLWFAYPKYANDSPVKAVNLYTGGDANGPQPTDENVIENLTMGEPQDAGIKGYACVELTIGEGYRGTGNLHIEATYENDDFNGGNIYLETQDVIDQREENQLTSLKDAIGFYTQFPENLDSRLGKTPFQVTDENRTLYFVYPDTWNGNACEGVDFYRGGEGGPEPTSQMILETASVGDPEPTGIDGLSCVAITIGSGFSGTGNLHMMANYGLGGQAGGNTLVTTEEVSVQEDSQLEQEQESGMDQQQDNPFADMGYYAEYPEDLSSRITDFTLHLTDTERSAWFVFPTEFQGEVCQGVEPYLGGDENGPRPTDEAIADNLTVGEIQDTGVEGLSCVELTIGEGFSGEGNLHLNVDYGNAGNAGGNVMVVTE